MMRTFKVQTQLISQLWTASEVEMRPTMIVHQNNKLKDQTDVDSGLSAWLPVTEELNRARILLIEKRICRPRVSQKKS